MAKLRSRPEVERPTRMYGCQNGQTVKNMMRFIVRVQIDRCGRYHHTSLKYF